MSKMFDHVYYKSIYFFLILQEVEKFFQTFSNLVKDDFDFRRHLNKDRQFIIGFPESGSNLEDLKDIKKCIACLVKDHEKILPVWAMFEHILEREKAKKIISRKTVSDYNEKLSEEFRMTSGNITDMLLFLHRVGTLIYFDEVKLNETIILDIQWFAQAFKCIVAYPVNIEDADDARERFQDTGEMDDKELDRIWKEKDKEYHPNKKELLAYMEQLGLLAVCKTGEKTFYYIPCMNRRRFEDNEEEMIKSSVLCFQFDKKGQLPIFLFHGVVIKCTKIPDWSFLREEDKNCLYDKVACFSFRNLIVVMCLCKFQIQVQVRVPTKDPNEVIEPELLENIQKSVMEKIEEYEKYSFRLGYKCQYGKLNDEGDDSFIAIEHFQCSKFICEKCPFNKKHYVENKTCWVSLFKK